MDRQAIDWACHAYLKSSDGASEERAIQHIRSAIADPDAVQAAREIQASVSELMSRAKLMAKLSDVRGNTYRVADVVQFAESVQLAAGAIDQFLTATLQSAGEKS